MLQKVSEDKTCRSETFRICMAEVTVRYRCLYEDNNTMRIKKQLIFEIARFFAIKTCFSARNIVKSDLKYKLGEKRFAYFDEDLTNVLGVISMENRARCSRFCYFLEK